MVVLAVTLLTEENSAPAPATRPGFGRPCLPWPPQLRHPSGQLALINVEASPPSGDGLTPVVLPFSALDYSDPFKARQAVEMSSCAVQWPNDGGQLCVGVGNSAYAGAVVCTWWLIWCCPRRRPASAARWIWAWSATR
ncbi:MAG: hypothetical protein R3E42_14670 [Burkholderiaceae bacterium]